MLVRTTVLAWAVSGAVAQAPLQPEEGEVFPAIRFTTLDGARASLAAYRGEKILLLQFASW